MIFYNLKFQVEIKVCPQILLTVKQKFQSMILKNCHQ